LIYQLHRELTLLMQDNDPVSVYFSKMKKIWDELQNLDGMPQCVCGIMTKCTCEIEKKLQERDARNKLIQFLMGLNSSHNVLRNQILAMEPLPTLNRAYYLIQQAEKQRQVSDAMNVKFEPEACAVQKQGYNPSKKDFKRGKNDKGDKYCTHCKVKGHLTDVCFKIHGYPEWYKQKYG